MRGFARALLIGYFLLPALAHSLDPKCTECARHKTTVAEKEKQMKSLETVLQKNNDYLTKYQRVPASISIKVKSNIMMASLKIETIQNEITLAKIGINSPACKNCEKAAN